MVVRSFSCGAMSGAPDDGQYVPAMKLMWDEVDRRFDPKYVLGEAGHQFCQSYSVRAAHPEFPYALHCLSLMCALANGARGAIFATAPSPLTLVAVNVNYAQTRKSSMTGHAEALGQELDTVILENAMSKLQQESFEEGAAQVLRRGFSKSNCPPLTMREQFANLVLNFHVFLNLCQEPKDTSDPAAAGI